MRFGVSTGRLAFAVILVVTGFAFCSAQAETVGSTSSAAASLDSIRQLLKDGKYADAESAARVHLAATETATGCESLETARAIDLLVESLWRGGKSRSAGALELAEQAISIRQKALGDFDPELSDSLSHAAIVQGQLGRHAEARKLLERALAVATATWGPDDDRVARIHANLGTRLYDADPTASERHEREALRIFEASLGPDSIQVADVLNGLANHAADRGEFATAEAAYERGIRINEAALGPRHPNVANGYNNLGYLHLETGDYEKARTELERALSIREETLGRAHAKTMMTLGNLAILDAHLGLPVGPRWEELLALADRNLGPDHPMPAEVRANYASSISEVDPERARRLNEEAYTSFVRIYGPEHHESLWVLSSLGQGALRDGDLATAERQLREAVSGLEKAPGAPPTLLFGARQSLARCRAESGATSEARGLFAQVLESKEKVQGPDHPSLASALDEYGAFLRQEGDLSGARSALEHALKIREKALGTEHPAVGDSLFALADLEAETGRLDEAVGLFRRALAIEEKARTPDDPRNAKGYREYASCLLRRGEAAAALDAALKAEDISSRQLRATLAGLSERQALGLVAKTPSALGLAVSAAVALRKPSAASRVLDTLVRSRALVLDEMSQRQRTLRADDTVDAARLFEAWVAARDQLARLTVLGEDEKSPEKSRKRLEKARAEKDAAERALADRSWEFRNERTRTAAGFLEVSSALPPGTALVALVRYAHLSRAKTGAHPTASSPTVDSYAAFVLKHGSRSPVLVPLGSASVIDAAVSSVSGSLARTSASLGGPSGSPTASYRRAAAALRDLIWSPLEAHFSGAKSVFVVPDGSLHLVSFAALPVGADSWLVEKGPALHYLSAERDLVSQRPPKGSGLLVAGAPDFDAPPRTIARSQTANLRGPSTPDAAPPLHRGPPSSCRDFASLRFAALPAAVQEIEEIAGLWRGASSAAAGKPRKAEHESAPLVLSGPAAHERAIKESAPGRQVVHLTTHGFFLGDCAASAEGGKRKPAGPGASTLYAENPLLLSGLALAGANRRSTAPPGADDGILTAEEVASLDLSGVEWVVLSACETGLGEARAGEGLFGLRRAFQVAGARTLITSLWPVEDQASRRWMKALYEGRLERGLSTAETAREASLTVLRERRAAGLSTHPFFWAGFVAAGDWP